MIKDMSQIELLPFRPDVSLDDLRFIEESKAAMVEICRLPKEFIFLRRDYGIHD